MIQRSQRGKQPRVSEPQPVTLNLHERIASQRLWFLRLMTASTVALTLSFILWLLRVPLEYHLGGIAVGFVAGLFARRPMQSWALAWIRERAGLSYETALEQRTRQDDFGFSETLQQRATQEVSRLSPPKYQVWWLPMLAVALGLAFLPLIPSVANLPSPFNTQAPTTTTTATNELNPSEPNQPTATQAANEPNATDSSASPSESTGETNASELNNPGGASESSASQNNQSADEQALERFLDNLKENEPPPSDSPDADLSSVMPQSQGGQSNEDNASRPRSTQTNPFARPGEEQQEQPNANQNSEQGQGEEQGQEQQGQDQQGQQEQSQEAQSEQGQGDEQASGGQEQSEQGAGEQAGGEPGTGQEGEQNQQGSGQSASAEGEGNEQQSDTGQNAEGAGSLAGTPSGQGEEIRGSSQQSPEFLQGRLDEGLNNTAGTVRLPGETSQTVFPEGSSPGSFSRAEEEALTEGRIPLEYQEVIRNYFRSNP
jgi:hypothetical protein